MLQLFEEEAKIKTRLETAKGSSAILLHQELDNLRELMAGDELADAVLALREGRPTTLEALHVIAQLDAEPAASGAVIRSDTRLEKLGIQRAGLTRRVFFVDYGFHQDNGFMLITQDDDISFFWTNATAQEIGKWKETWLAHQPETPAPASSGDAESYYPLLRDEEELEAALELLSRISATE